MSLHHNPLRTVAAVQNRVGARKLSVTVVTDPQTRYKAEAKAEFHGNLLLQLYSRQESGSSHID